jgi:tRNA-dihydrouridine synthase
VPFTVGGGIRNLEDMFEVLKAGAEKISIDSMAVRNPEIIHDGARAFGSQTGGAQAAIISSILYSPRLDRNIGVRELKAGLAERDVPIRPYLDD